ncbi:hypothetical protein HDU97_001736 [Phlyctochytrium planicorne]|nr:hypothetical protein HDU97_001736 [Phlyctochytrium planicorne]
MVENESGQPKTTIQNTPILPAEPRFPQPPPPPQTGAKTFHNTPYPPPLKKRPFAQKGPYVAEPSEASSSAAASTAPIPLAPKEAKSPSMEPQTGLPNSSSTSSLQTTTTAPAIAIAAAAAASTPAKPSSRALVSTPFPSTSSISAVTPAALAAALSKTFSSALLASSLSKVAAAAAASNAASSTSAKKTTATTTRTPSLTGLSTIPIASASSATSSSSSSAAALASTKRSANGSANPAAASKSDPYILQHNNHSVSIFHQEDARDKVLMAIVKALMEMDNRPSTPRELTACILDNQFTHLGGLTPHATVSSRISTHYKRCSLAAEAGEERQVLLGRRTYGDGNNPRKLRYYINQLPTLEDEEPTATSKLSSKKSKKKGGNLDKKRKRPDNEEEEAIPDDVKLALSRTRKVHNYRENNMSESDGEKERGPNLFGPDPDTYAKNNKKAGRKSSVSAIRDGKGSSQKQKKRNYGPEGSPISDDDSMGSLFRSSGSPDSSQDEGDGGTMEHKTTINRRERGASYEAGEAHQDGSDPMVTSEHGPYEREHDTGQGLEDEDEEIAQGRTVSPLKSGQYSSSPHPNSDLSITVTNPAATSSSYTQSTTVAASPFLSAHNPVPIASPWLAALHAPPPAHYSRMQQQSGQTHSSPKFSSHNLPSRMLLPSPVLGASPRILNPMSPSMVPPLPSLSIPPSMYPLELEPSVIGVSSQIHGSSAAANAAVSGIRSQHAAVSASRGLGTTPVLSFERPGDPVHPERMSMGELDRIFTDAEKAPWNQESGRVLQQRRQSISGIGPTGAPLQTAPGKRKRAGTLTSGKSSPIDPAMAAAADASKAKGKRKVSFSTKQTSKKQKTTNADDGSSPDSLKHSNLSVDVTMTEMEAAATAALWRPVTPFTRSYKRAGPAFELFEVHEPRNAVASSAGASAASPAVGAHVQAEAPKDWSFSRIRTAPVITLQLRTAVVSRVTGTPMSVVSEVGGKAGAGAILPSKIPVGGGTNVSSPATSIVSGSSDVVTLGIDIRGHVRASDLLDIVDTLNAAASAPVLLPTPNPVYTQDSSFGGPNQGALVGTAFGGATKPKASFLSGCLSEIRRQVELMRPGTASELVKTESIVPSPSEAHPLKNVENSAMSPKVKTEAGLEKVASSSSSSSAPASNGDGGEDEVKAAISLLGLVSATDVSRTKSAPSHFQSFALRFIADVTFSHAREELIVVVLKGGGAIPPECQGIWIPVEIARRIAGRHASIPLLASLFNIHIEKRSIPPSLSLLPPPPATPPHPARMKRKGSTNSIVNEKEKDSQGFLIFESEGEEEEETSPGGEGDSFMSERMASASSTEEVCPVIIDASQLMLIPPSPPSPGFEEAKRYNGNIPIWMTNLDNVYVYITWMEGATSKPSSSSSSHNTMQLSPSEEIGKGIPIVRRVDNDMINATLLLHAGGLSTDREKSIVLSLERAKTRNRRQGSPMFGTWIPLARAREMARSLCLDSKLELFLDDSLGVLFGFDAPLSGTRRRKKGSSLSSNMLLGSGTPGQTESVPKESPSPALSASSKPPLVPEAWTGSSQTAPAPRKPSLTPLDAKTLVAAITSIAKKQTATPAPPTPATAPVSGPASAAAATGSIAKLAAANANPSAALDTKTLTAIMKAMTPGTMAPTGGAAGIAGTASASTTATAAGQTGGKLKSESTATLTALLAAILKNQQASKNQGVAVPSKKDASPNLKPVAPQPTQTSPKIPVLSSGPALAPALALGRGANVSPADASPTKSLAVNEQAPPKSTLAPAAATASQPVKPEMASALTSLISVLKPAGNTAPAIFPAPQTPLPKVPIRPLSNTSSAKAPSPTNVASKAVVPAPATSVASGAVTPAAPASTPQAPATSALVAALTARLRATMTSSNSALTPAIISTALAALTSAASKGSTGGASNPLAGVTPAILQALVNVRAGAAAPEAGPSEPKPTTPAKPLPSLLPAIAARPPLAPAPASPATTVKISPRPVGQAPVSLSLPAPTASATSPHSNLAASIAAFRPSALTMDALDTPQLSLPSAAAPVTTSEAAAGSNDVAVMSPSQAEIENSTGLEELLRPTTDEETAHILSQTESVQFDMAKLGQAGFRTDEGNQMPPISAEMQFDSFEVPSEMLEATEFQAPESVEATAVIVNEASVAEKGPAASQSCTEESDEAIQEHEDRATLGAKKLPSTEPVRGKGKGKSAFPFYKPSDNEPSSNDESEGGKLSIPENGDSVDNEAGSGKILVKGPVKPPQFGGKAKSSSYSTVEESSGSDTANVVLKDIVSSISAKNSKSRPNPPVPAETPRLPAAKARGKGKRVGRSKKAVEPKEEPEDSVEEPDSDEQETPVVVYGRGKGKGMGKGKVPARGLGKGKTMTMPVHNSDPEEDEEFIDIEN